MLRESNHISGVVFLQPLVLAGEDSVVECMLGVSASFDVRTYSVQNGRLDGSTRHCSGKTDAAADLNFPQEDGQVSGATSEFDLANLYRNFFRLGLQYGPRYRLLMHGQRSTDNSNVTLAELPARLPSKQQGTHIHPADLDATIQLCLMPRDDEDELRLPFAVEGAQLVPLSNNRSSNSLTVRHVCSDDLDGPTSFLTSHRLVY